MENFATQKIHYHNISLWSKETEVVIYLPPVVSVQTKLKAQILNAESKGKHKGPSHFTDWYNIIHQYTICFHLHCARLSQVL